MCVCVKVNESRTEEAHLIGRRHGNNPTPPPGAKSINDSMRFDGTMTMSSERDAVSYFFIVFFGGLFSCLSFFEDLGPTENGDTFSRRRIRNIQSRIGIYKKKTKNKRKIKKPVQIAPKK